MEELAPNTILIWQLSFHQPLHVVYACWQRLTPPEQIRATRFVRERDGRRYVLARGTLRLLLGRYLNQQPQQVRLQYGRFGKPFVCSADRLSFNISHAHNIALLAFTRLGDIGVDVERRRSFLKAGSITPQLCSIEEQRYLHSLPATERARVLAQIWVRKEAVVKATGRGLSQGLDSFSALTSSTQSTMCWRDLPASATYAAAVAFPQRCTPHIKTRWLPLEEMSRPMTYSVQNRRVKKA